MKKLLALALALLMASACALAMAEAMEVLPEADTTNFTIDPANPLACLAKGYYVDDIGLEDGSVRQIYHYYPDNLPYRRPAVFVGMPSGEDPTTFLVDSGWKAIADSVGLNLNLLVPGEGGWQADETAYTAAAYDFVQDRKYYTNDDSAYYLVGYGDAANAVMTEAIVQPNLYAGVAALGLDGDLSDAIAYAKETDLELLAVAPDQPGDPSVAIKLSGVELPVWIGAAEKTQNVAAVIDYWKDVNHDADDALSNAYADEIYAPAPYLSASNQLTYQELSKVVVSLGERDYTDADFVGYLWDKFLSRARRQDAGNEGALRYFASPDELGMDYYTMEVDGVTREFYVYVPSEVKAGFVECAPVVFCFHGSGGASYEFTSRSGWYKLAEDSNFILVTPTGSRNSSFRASTAWSDDSDPEFFLNMREFMLANYPADASRIYITGQSAGTAFTFKLAGMYPNLIAALASCSLVGVYEEVPDAILYVCENPVEEYDIPIMVSAGMYDRHFSSTGGANAAKEVFGAYWLRRNGVAVSWDSVDTYQNGSVTAYVANNANGVPMFRFQWLSWKQHATVPTELPSLYDFMSHYTRGEDGTLYYMGKPVR